MSDDLELLRRFARERDEAAFAEVVRRNIDFVYRTALRQVNGDGHLAQDVTQAVFLQLARKARTVAGHRVLAGWLHHTTRFCARSAVRSERRWQKREQEAHNMINESRELPSDADWARLHPVLDEVLQEIDADDREALLLRYYESRPFAELGARIGLAENAARMRVERALEKLRARLARRGITSTTAALATAMASQPAICAPAALATVVIQSSLAGAAAGSAATATTLILMSTTKIIATGAGIAALFVIGYYAGSNQPPSPAASEAESSLRSQVTQLRQENRRLATEVVEMRAAAEAAPVVAPAQPPAARVAEVAIPYNPVIPPRLEANAATTTASPQAIMNNLRQLGAAASQFRLENGRDPVSAEELVGPTKYIKALNVVDGESYANLDFSRNGALTVTMADGVSVTYGGTGATSTPVKTPFQQATERAQSAFLAANAGRSPVGNELAEYFDEPRFREAFVDNTRIGAMRQYVDAGLAPALDKAGKAFEGVYKAAYGSAPPKTFQAYEALASFIENDDDRARYVSALRKVGGLGGQ